MKDYQYFNILGLLFVIMAMVTTNLYASFLPFLWAVAMFSMAIVDILKNSKGAK